MKHMSLGHSSALVSIIVATGIFLTILTVGCSNNTQSTTRITTHQAKNAHIDGSIAQSFKSLGALKGSATLIVLGKIKAHKFVTNSQLPDTLSTVEIERVLKGNTAIGQNVVLSQVGGTTSDGTEWIMDGYPLLKIGAEYIVFLTPGLTANAYYSVGAPQGVFTVSTNGLVNSLSTEAAQVGVSVQNVPLNTFIQQIQLAPNIPAQK